VISNFVAHSCYIPYISNLIQKNRSILVVCYHSLILNYDFNSNFRSYYHDIFRPSCVHIFLIECAGFCAESKTLSNHYHSNFILMV
jgi:hypothetical protein